MTRRILFPLTLAAAAALSACASDKPTPRPASPLTVVSSASAASSATKSTPASAAESAPASTTAHAAAPQEPVRAAYSAALDHPGDFPPSPAAQFDPTGTYSYALVEATGDSSPELLLRIDSRGFSPVIVLTIEGGRAVASTDNIIDGQATAGGSFSKIFASREGRGIYQVDGHSIQTAAQSQRFVLQGRSLATDGPAVGFTKDVNPPADQVPLTWFGINDRSGLDTVQGRG
ncbi:hypothetical protein [Corynebacterium liangguodongii]|uniref:Uncharacterized protein n=1 Tax=Corynebacterium liangguodongii TaxID=2079535 RepID=A0A2S0WC20_9CORY|nr:hypothetical protein [Corynebacterium liangguodongii]AWB83319.1 hypothetical protein C3E79_01475 [Corynebacterium liangguodongii]PWC00591.1 hypothetical protein DF219_01475 [Corynebacterium liangguodongii]